MVLEADRSSWPSCARRRLWEVVELGKAKKLQGEEKERKEKERESEKDSQMRERERENGNVLDLGILCWL